jgi:trehalose synthase
VQDVPIAAQSPARLQPVLTEAQWSELVSTIERARDVIDARVIWNVNSTARGGGVAELLHSLVPYIRGAGLDGRWQVIGGTPAFFALTKRLHNRLHGIPGDGGPLADRERALYESISADNARELSRHVRPDDLVLLHDPQTAGLVRPLLDRGARVVWRCHVGLDVANDCAHSAWDFLRPYVQDADAYVFSRNAFAWDDLDRDRLFVIPPSIDVFGPKNQELDRPAVAAILATAGLSSGAADNPPVFTRGDGSPGRVDGRAVLIEDAPLPEQARVVTQVSRWDRLKDPSGVLAGYAAGIAPRTDAHLVLAAPAVAAVKDDPEGEEVFEEVRAQREDLPRDVRSRVHLALLPMEDVEENGAIVNALQRRSDVVCQKSIAEGFGLTVVEAMWKSRPVVASAVGGIQDQIVDGESGLLVDPGDLDAFADAVSGLLADPARATRLGAQANLRVRDEFLAPRHLRQYVDLFAHLLGSSVVTRTRRAGSSG